MCMYARFVAVNRTKTYLGSTQNRHQDRQQFPHDRQKLIFCEVCSDKFGEHLHSTMGGAG